MADCVLSQLKLNKGSSKLIDLKHSINLKYSMPGNVYPVAFNLYKDKIHQSIQALKALAAQRLLDSFQQKGPYTVYKESV